MRMSATPGPAGNVFASSMTCIHCGPIARPIVPGVRSPAMYQRQISGFGAAGDYSPGAVAYGAVSTASMAVSAFHGYKRNQSIGWALLWGLLGATFPVITPAIAVAQGFGKRKTGR